MTTDEERIKDLEEWVADARERISALETLVDRLTKIVETLAGVTPMSPRQIVTPTNATSRGDKSDTEGVTPMSPKPSLRTVIEPSLKTKRVDESFIAAMVAKYQDKYGSEQAVRDEISDALNHKAVDKRKDVQRYVDTWLRRGMPTLAPRRNGTHTTSPTSAADDILSHPIFGPIARRQLEQA